MTPIFIVILIILVIAGPILTMMPSRRDRQLSALRQEAYRSGFRVEVLKDDFVRKLGEEPGLPSWMLYWVPWPPTVSEAAVKALQPTVSRDPGQLPAGLPALGVPEPFAALYLDPRRVGLVWQEKGYAENMGQALADFKAALEQDA